MQAVHDITVESDSSHGSKVCGDSSISIELGSTLSMQG
jgi:hypothetical protein